MIPIFQYEAKAKLYSRLEKRKAEFSGQIAETVRGIISQVRKGGDRALLKLTRELDHVNLTAKQLRVQPSDSARGCCQSRSGSGPGIGKSHF